VVSPSAESSLASFFGRTLLKDPSLVNLGHGIEQVVLLGNGNAVQYGLLVESGTFIFSTVLSSSLASNGALYIVDLPLIPPPDLATTLLLLQEGTPGDMLQLIQAASLLPTLAATPGITILTAVVTPNITGASATATVLYNVLPVVLYSTSFQDGLVLPTLQGDGVMLQAGTGPNVGAWFLVGVNNQVTEIILQDNIMENGVAILVTNLLLHD